MSSSWGGEIVGMRCGASILALLVSVSLGAEVVVERQIVGPIKVNSYLIYDAASGEAAIVDPGGPVERLLSVIDARGLDLKYILVTHAHADHVAGIPALRECFPLVKLCMSSEEAEDAKLYAQWAEKLNPKEVAQIRSNPAALELMNFDPARIGPVDVTMTDGKTVMLGETPVRAWLAPGHSRGSICYLAGTVLFSGDVLFHRKVGRSDLPGGGGWDQLVVSVRRLYASLPDSIEVYPGHGQPTDIGSEKRENLRISETAVRPPSS